jgi:hypothetical protein
MLVCWSSPVTSTDPSHPELRRGLFWWSYPAENSPEPPLNLNPEPLASAPAYIPTTMESCLDDDYDTVNAEIRLTLSCPTDIAVSRSTNSVSAKILQIVADSYNLNNRFGLCDDMDRYVERADMTELINIDGTMVMNVNLVGKCKECDSNLYTTHDDADDRRLDRHDHQGRRNLAILQLLLDTVSDRMVPECKCNVGSGQKTPSPIFTEHADTVDLITGLSTDCKVLSMEQKVGAGFSTEDVECVRDGDCEACEECDENNICVPVTWDCCVDDKECDHDEVCNEEDNKCVECTKDHDCKKDEVCDTQNHECVECNNDDDCEDLDEDHKFICVVNECEECNKDDDCKHEDYFEEQDKMICHDNECVECETGKDCEKRHDGPDDGRLFCHDNECVECEKDKDCKKRYDDPDDGRLFCHDNECVECEKDGDCPADRSCVDYKCD